MNAQSPMRGLFGRQSTVPAADAPDTTAGTITLGYFDDDLPHTVTQGGTATTFTLDAAGRRATQTTTTSAGTTTTVRRYADDGDNPAWVETTAPGAATASVTRFAESIGGDLAATIDPDGTAGLSLADPHGDVVTTVTIDAAQTSSTPAVAIDGWASYDEYGNPADSAATNQVDGPVGYGWLGADQRSASSDTAGLTLMGIRLYNPTRGSFASVDPVVRGNVTAYIYPNDPVNLSDISGRAVCSTCDGGGGSGWEYFYSFDIKIGTMRMSSASLAYALAHGGVNSIFPLGMWGCFSLYVGAVCHVAGGSVRVTRSDSRGWSFISLPGHTEGANNRISFNVYKVDGVMRLSVLAYGNTAGILNAGWLGSVNLAFARNLWGNLAYGIYRKYSWRSS